MTVMVADNVHQFLMQPLLEKQQPLMQSLQHAHNRCRLVGTRPATRGIEQGRVTL
jgi:hypothetical protein